MKMKRHCLAALTLAGIILGQAAARADEGMWLIQDINSALEKKMQDRGLKLSAGEIYNADAPGLRSPMPSFRWDFIVPEASFPIRDCSLRTIIVPTVMFSR